MVSVSASISTPATSSSWWVSSSAPGELGTGSADTVQPFGARRLTPHPLAKRVLCSNTLLRLPTFDVEGYIRDRMAYKFMVPEEYAFINGTGLSQPLGILRRVAALSPSPSIRPMTMVAVPNTLARKRGRRVKISSLLTSVRKLTNPRKKILGCRPRG